MAAVSKMDLSMWSRTQIEEEINCVIRAQEVQESKMMLPKAFRDKRAIGSLSQHDKGYAPELWNLMPQEDKATYLEYQKMVCDGINVKQRRYRPKRGYLDRRIYTAPLTQI